MNRYPINKSPLFELSNKRRLAELLSCDFKELKSFKWTRKNYEVWKEKKKDGKLRPIEAPKAFIKRLQGNLQRLLSRIEISDFLISGKKGKNFVDNARYHKDTGEYVLCLDIKGFYQSVPREAIFKAFHKELGIAEDVAWLLTDLVSYPIDEKERKGYLPTGSPTSQVIGFWAYKSFFETMNSEAEARGMKMSIYVDDITFSSCSPITRGFIDFVDRSFLVQGLRIKRNKTHLFKPGTSKLITGAILDAKQRIRIPNKKRKEIVEFIEAHPIESMNGKETQQIFGKINSVRQIEHNKFGHIYPKLRTIVSDLMKKNHCN